jgi:hypothetical protein
VVASAAVAADVTKHSLLVRLEGLRGKIAALSFSEPCRGGCPHPPRLSAGSAVSQPGVYPCGMDKKEIESPKLTVNFLIWISAFMILLFLLIGHFVWRIF